MDFWSLVVFLLIAGLILTVAYLIIAKLIMPAIKPELQVLIWAVIGVLLLIVVIYWGQSYFASHGHAIKLP
jgi:hypothetical protein